VENYTKELQEYKDFFLKYCVIFNYGMMPKNILLRKTSESESNLVLIDGLGDITYFTFPNKIPYFARQKINRRWDKFTKKYLTKKRVLE
ncbi:MAG: PhoP regulatory network YrbL family protein, partial [Sulfurimonas sp.]|nr:PhoP regulatory network YrbL family protein [Sulfurimonas sp.]